MNSFLLGALTVAALVAVGVLRSRRVGSARIGSVPPDDLAPGFDPQLALVMRANHALGVWVCLQHFLTARRAVDARLDTASAEMITARLELLARRTGGGTELLECGVLVHQASEGAVAVALLARGGSPSQVNTVGRDLAELLERLRREPILAAVGREQDRPEESVESVAMRLAHQVERLLDTEVAVALARPQGVQVLGVSLRGDPRLLLALAAPGSPLEKVGRGIVAGPLVSDDPLGRSGKERRRARPRAVVLPIPGSDLTVGAVVVATPDGAIPGGPIRGELLQVLHAAGPRLARALDRQELQEISLCDPLTGLRNRRGLDQALTRVEHGEGALIYADLDRFKALNDALGHAAGDAALVHFARAMAQAIRSGDVAARIGGEEFALWLPGATLSEGVAAAERIRSGLAEVDWTWQGRHWPVTASFGVASCPETVPGVEHLASRADGALYQAKQAGRNRVAVAG